MADTSVYQMMTVPTVGSVLGQTVVLVRALLNATARQMFFFATEMRTVAVGIVRGGRVNLVES